MFFPVSKIVWAAIAPANLLALLIAGGLVLALLGRGRAGRALMIAGAVGYLVAGASPLGNILLRPLEDRFPRPAGDFAPPYGIIVLGGGVDEEISDTRHILMLGTAGSRMTEAVALARRFPKARLVFTGGDSKLVPGGLTEAETARRLFTAVGAPMDRFTFETRSRDTWENAIFTRDLVHPQPGQRWLLVTSAFHMPRSMGVFRKAGFDVIPWPADYLTSGRESDFWKPSGHVADGLGRVESAMHEWVGLVAYRIAGKTDALLPAVRAPAASGPNPRRQSLRGSPSL
jgi:uncharacterized SAM-binding protein YcdF (DUF218 family)